MLQEYHDAPVGSAGRSTAVYVLCALGAWIAGCAGEAGGNASTASTAAGNFCAADGTTACGVASNTAAVLVCGAGVWQPLFLCDAGQYCSAQAGTPQCIAVAGADGDASGEVDTFAAADGDGNGPGECASPKDCDDQDYCTLDDCAAGECTHSPLTDGSFCGKGMVCAVEGCQLADPCVPGAKACESTLVKTCGPDGRTWQVEDCNDGNGCTLDGCQPGTFTCTYTAKVGACIGLDTCTEGVCEGDKCITKPAHDGKVCADKNACTPDTCQGGECVSGPPICGPSATCFANWACACKPGDLGDGLLCSPNPCKAGYLPIAVDGEQACVPDYPVWGLRPVAPGALFAVDGEAVIDVQTKLVWQTAASGLMAWGAAKVHCDGLVVANKNDWRLPTMAELETLFDFTAAAKTPSVFANSAAGSYWSLTPWSVTTANGQPPAAWVAQFGVAGNSIATTNSQTGMAFARCVRGQAVQVADAVGMSSRFVVKGDVFTDGLTKLTWPRKPTTGFHPWQTAEPHCAGLELDGGGWRVPTVVELSSLVVRSANTDSFVDADAFEVAPVVPWSNTPAPGDTLWHVNFRSGGTSSSAKGTAWDVLCVK
jgi:hypothetical protein